MYKESVDAPSGNCEQVRERLASTLKLINQCSHEINNQLTIIIGRSEQSMLAAREDHLLQTYLDEICNSARRVADATRRLALLRM